MSLDTEAAKELFARRDAKFCGSIRVPLDQLEFPFPNDAAVPYLDPKNVQRLIHVFELEGCFRDDHENRIPALVSRKALKRVGVVPSRHGAVSLVKQLPGGPLKGLHGRHRHAAAKEYFLDASERWWTVDLYDNSTSNK